MEIKNCKGCGRMFQYNGSGLALCQGCRKKLEEGFQRVKEYLKENPNCSINELAESAEVTVSQINQWIREERLLFSKDSPIGIDCESCGKMIKSGRYCPECKSNLLKNLGNGDSKPKSAVRTPKGSAKGKMRFLDR